MVTMMMMMMMLAMIDDDDDDDISQTDIVIVYKKSLMYFAVSALNDALYNGHKLKSENICSQLIRHRVTIRERHKLVP
jgi:hypothetical protein